MAHIFRKDVNHNVCHDQGCCKAGRGIDRNGIQNHQQQALHFRSYKAARIPGHEKDELPAECTGQQFCQETVG